MLVDSRTVELTQSFYDWEMRGRGWVSYPNPVVLEPPFRPFREHLARSERLDDSRRQTWLSSLFERLGGDKRQPPEIPAAIEKEPLPEPDPQSGEDLELEELVIALPEDARVPRAALLSWLRSLSTVSGPVSFELLGGERRVEMRLTMAAEDAPHVRGQLQAAMPSVVVVEARESLAERWAACSGHNFSAIEFGLANEFMIPLAGFRSGEESLLPLVAALADIDVGELGLFQVLFKETGEPWEESLLRAVVTASGKPFFADAPEITAAAKVKVSSPLFAVAVRVASAAGDGDRTWEILQRVASGLAHFGNPRANELMPLPAEEHLERLELDLLGRSTHRSGMLLSAEELVSLVLFPGPGVQVPELWRASEKTKAAPAEVTASGCLLGSNEHVTGASEVRLPAETKTKHVHVVGSSGTGKSTLLVRMILEDIEAGHGVGVLDPHGDLIDEVAARVPDSRLSDVVLFDPSEDETAIGWNILGAQSEVEKDLLASDLVGVFRRLSTSWGDQMTAVLANAILVFLESERGGTLLDLRRFLVDEGFRREMLETVSDDYVASFWKTEFPLLIGRKPQAPILTRLDMFLRSRLVRQVVTVRKPKLDFREVTDSGRIFLGKLAAGAIGEENAALLGSLLVSKFHQVTLAREAQAIEERRPFFLYIDEFHHVATPSMASLFSGMRKYRLGLTVAHQDLYQLHRSVPEVERSLLANAYTRICFRVGAEDARGLAKGLSFFEAEDLMGLGLGAAICRVGGRDGDFNLQTERLPPLDREDARERIAVLRDLSGRRWRGSDGEQPEAPARARREPKKAAEPAARVSEKRTSSPPPEQAEPAKPPPEKTEPQPQLDKEALDYLELVATEPFLSVRERNEHLGLSAWKGDQIKKALLDRELAREVAVNPGGRGERFKLLEFTQAGRQTLADYGIAAPTGRGRGGIAHQWWVNTIAEWLREQGLSPAIEDESQGARVDLLVSARRKKIAVEVEMGEGHALENIRKDLEAGSDLVVSLLDDSASAERIQRALAAETEDLRPKVRIGILQDYEELLSPPLIPHPPPLRGPNQDKEPRGRRRQRRRAAPPATGASRLSELGALTTPMAANYVGLSPATLETLRVRGGGPVFVKLGARVVYDREDLDRWLAERKRRSTSDGDTKGA